MGLFRASKAYRRILLAPGGGEYLPFLQDAIAFLLDKMKVPAQEYANKIVAKIIKIVFLAVVGVSFLTTGLIFILIAVVTYLTQLMAAWLAWGIVGLVTALVGTVLLLLIRR